MHFAWFGILLNAMKPNAPYMSGLGAMLPMIIYFGLCFITVPMTIFYLYKLISGKWEGVDTWIMVLIVMLVVGVLTYDAQIDFLT